MLGVGFNKSSNGPLKLWAFPGNIWVLFCKQRVAKGRGGSISNCKNVYFTYYSYEIANAIALMFMLRGNNKNRNFCKYILTSSKTIAAHEKKLLEYSVPQRQRRNWTSKTSSWRTTFAKNKDFMWSDWNLTPKLFTYEKLQCERNRAENMYSKIPVTLVHFWISAVFGQD